MQYQMLFHTQQQCQIQLQSKHSAPIQASVILREASALPLLCVCRDCCNRIHYHGVTNALCAIHALHRARTCLCLLAEPVLHSNAVIMHLIIIHCWLLSSFFMA